MNTAFWSATRLARALRAKKLGALELFDLYAARIRKHNRALNAVCVMDLDAGRKAARANVMRHSEWLRWSNRRHQMRLAWAEFFRDWDVLLCPPATTPAFPQNQQGERWQRMIDVNGRPQPSTTQMFWAGYSGMCYLPATVAPIELSGGKLPVGVQIVGPQYADYRTIEVARRIELEYFSFTPPPGYE